MSEEVYIVLKIPEDLTYEVRSTIHRHVDKSKIADIVLRPNDSYLIGGKQSERYYTLRGLFNREINAWKTARNNLR